MNVPPKLFDLAFEIVVNCYTVGLLPTKVIPPNSIISDQIFETVMRARDYSYDAHTVALVKEFKPTKLELNLKNCQQASFSEIRKLKLTELKLRNFCQISKYIVRVAGPPQRGKLLAVRPVPKHKLSALNYPKRAPKNDYIPVQRMPEHFFIAHFLGDILSEESKRELRVLDISGGQNFEDNWMETASFMFPKLEVLNVSHRDFSNEDFAIACNNLPNLNTLRIGHSQLKTLKGICKLTNLTNLVIDDSHFPRMKDIVEIFSLKNLETLILSENRSTRWKYDYFFAKPFPELTHLEIKWREADDGFLRKILPKLPKLHVVVANDTVIHENAAPPPITVYTKTDLKSIVKSLKYFRTTGNREGILNIYLYRTLRPSTPEEMTVCVDEMESMLETFKFDKKLSEKAITCLDCLAGQTISENQEANADKIVIVFLRILKHHLRIRTPPEDEIFKKIFLRIERLIFVARNPSINTICALSMRTILLGKGGFVFEQMCAFVLSEFLDDMDLSSELFESINFRKVHESLTKIVKREDQCLERKRRTAQVIRYIEIFM